jgi:CrcB protein
VGAYLWIALGSAIGGAARYGVGTVSLYWLGHGFPWGTLFINVTGSFAIGFFNTLTEPDGRFFVPQRLRQFFMIGICGGYTTFSAFSLETIELVERGRALAAASYGCVSMILCLIAVWIGHALAASLNRLKT